MSYFNQTWILSRLPKNPQMRNFTKILQWEQPECSVLRHKTWTTNNRFSQFCERACNSTRLSKDSSTVIRPGRLKAIRMKSIMRLQEHGGSPVSAAYSDPVSYTSAWNTTNIHSHSITICWPITISVKIRRRQRTLYTKNLPALLRASQVGLCQIAPAPFLILNSTLLNSAVLRCYGGRSVPTATQEHNGSSAHGHNAGPSYVLPLPRGSGR